jgi:hypothetical protein
MQNSKESQACGEARALLELAEAQLLKLQNEGVKKKNNPFLKKDEIQPSLFIFIRFKFAIGLIF